MRVKRPQIDDSQVIVDPDREKLDADIEAAASRLLGRIVSYMPKMSDPIKSAKLVELINRVQVQRKAFQKRNAPRLNAADARATCIGYLVGLSRTEFFSHLEEAQEKWHERQEGELEADVTMQALGAAPEPTEAAEH